MGKLAVANRTASATLPCVHHDRSADHLLTGVLVAGMTLARAVAEDPALKVAAARLEGALKLSAAPAPLNAAVFPVVERQLTRLVAAYRPAIKLIKLLFESHAPSLEGDHAVQLSGFLFDMNRFFQALMARFLQESLTGYDVHEEHGLTEMLRYVPSANPRSRRAPRPRPDFAIARRGQLRALLDAKYRDLWHRELPRDMLYQLSVYALSQPRGATAAILYPTPSTDAREALIEIREPVGGSARAWVALRPVIVPELVAALTAPATIQREHLARRLVFGESTMDTAVGVAAM